MKGKTMYKTLIAIIVVIIVFIGIHMYNNLVIQSITFEEEWGRGTNIGETTFGKSPFITNLGDEILTVVFNKDSSINYYITDLKGELKKETNQQIDEFELSNAKNIDLSNKALLFTKDSKLFVSLFDKESGFSDGELFLDNIEAFRVDEVNNKTILQAYNNEEVLIYEIEGDNFNKIYSFDNKWDISNVLFTSEKDMEYIFIVNRIDIMTFEVLGGKIVDGDIVDLKRIEEIAAFGSVSINSFEVENLDGRMYLCYSVRQSSKGSATIYISTNVLNENNLNVISNKRIQDSTLDEARDMGQYFTLYNNGKTVSLINSALYTNNKYAIEPDIFKVEIDKQGKLSSPVFLTNTQGYSKNPSITNTKHGAYLTWLDVEVGKYKVMLNSTNDEYIEYNMKFTRDDYKRAFLKALTSPFSAIAYGAIRAVIFFSIIFFIFLFIGILIKFLKIEDDRIKLGLFLLAYIIYNYIMFSNNYYNDATLALMPDILKIDIIKAIMPLLLNAISGLLLYVFIREKKGGHYFIYLTFYVLIDIYFTNLFFIPFSMVNMLSS